MKEFYERIWSEIVDDDKVLDEKWKRWKNDKRRNRILNMIKPYLKGKCLEAGCANGLITNELNKIIPTEGMDFCQTAIKSARKKYPHLKFRSCDVTKMPYRDKSFDCIFAGEIIEHVPDTISMFNEFRRILKPKGKLIITTPEFNFLKNLIITFFYWDEFYSPKNEHVRFYTKKSLRAILKEAKFKPIFEHSEKHYGIIPNIMIIAAKKI
jgi:ubiquinone/menaquinone biosynthesis C-methylase UbiE